MAFIIAEIGINHNGDVDLAIDLIRMAHRAGVDAVKFQKRDIDTVYTEEFLAGPRESPWGSTQRAQKEGLELNQGDYEKIDAECHRLRIPWFASAWDFKSLTFLEQFSLGYQKIASAMLTNEAFVEAVAKQGVMTFISTGMTAMEEIERVVGVFDKAHCPFALLHCVSTYPCRDEDCNLKMIETLLDEFPGTKVGYSGHERGIQPSLAAVALGAKIIERHITMDRTMYGSDQAASVEEPGLRRLVEYSRQIEAAMGDGVKRIIEAERKTERSLRYWL